MSGAEALQESLKGLWSTYDLCQMFRRTSMTITLWRQNRGLPALLVPGNKRSSIRFVPQDVIDWANDNQVTIYQAANSTPRYRSTRFKENQAEAE